MIRRDDNWSLTLAVGAAFLVLACLAIVLVGLKAIR
jgi:hypothetical protein